MLKSSLMKIFHKVKENYKYNDILTIYEDV